MTRHHRRSRQSVRHSWCQLVNSVAACGITHDVNTIRINTFEHDGVLNNAFEKFVYMSLMPQVPGVSRCTRRQIDSLFRFVQSDLISPLLLVDACRSATSPVHRNEQAATGFICLAECFEFEFHFQVVQFDDLLFPFFLAIRLDLFDVIVPEQFFRFDSLLFGNRLFCP